MDGSFFLLKLSGLNVARFLTDSLRGPVLAHYDEAEGRVWWDGRTDGRTDGNQKCPLIFFILRYIKHWTYIYINMDIKIVRTNFLWVLNFGQVGGPDTKIQKHPLGWIFLKSV